MVGRQSIIGFSLGFLSSFASASVVVKLNGTSYYSPDAIEALLECSSPPVTKITPFTYLDTASSASISPTLDDFVSKDDVFSTSFLSTVLVDGNVTANDFGDWQAYINKVLVPSSTGVSLNGSLRPGPYFLSPDGSISKAYRLYTDPNFAWVESITGPDADGVYAPVSGSTGDGVNGGVSVAVPSRLYYPDASDEKPLSGLRFGIKDIIDVKGIRTSLGSRAVFSLDRIGNETAPSIQNLVDLGAVLIGKVKTTQYALSEEPTGDYIDQLGPFNPRGDGYQLPQGSSSGSGVSVFLPFQLSSELSGLSVADFDLNVTHRISANLCRMRRSAASYDWLDFAVGTDTGG